MLSQTLQHKLLLETTRRHFLERCGVGLGAMALAELVGGQRAEAASGLAPEAGRPAPRG
ncbi:MAG: twin-arginine translocation signal domain-containing protein, partial [Aureliella sp.]